MKLIQISWKKNVLGIKQLLIKAKNYNSDRHNWRSDIYTTHTHHTHTHTRGHTHTHTLSYKERIDYPKMGYKGGGITKRGGRKKGRKGNICKEKLSKKLIYRKMQHFF